SAFSRIYAPGTRQNHAGEPGLYRFYLAHTWTTATLPDGNYRLEVEASDLAGNTGSLAKRVTIANNGGPPFPRRRGGRRPLRWRCAHGGTRTSVSSCSRVSAWRARSP